MPDLKVLKFEAKTKNRGTGWKKDAIFLFRVISTEFR